MPDVEKLNAAIDAYSSLGGSNHDRGELSRQRALALDAYAGENLDPAPEGRSQVVDRTGFETVQWIMPSMMRIFAGGDNIVEFEPTGPEDEEVAEQESDYLNYLVTQRNDWDLTVREFCQDALITKNAYCMAYMEEKLQPEIERYENQSEEQVMMLLDEDIEVVGQESMDDPNAEPMMVDPATGEPIDPQDEATMAGAMAIYASQGMEPEMQTKQIYNIEIKKVKASKTLRFKVLPPERCIVGEDTGDFTLEDANYFEYWDSMTISDLRKQGYDVDDEIADEGDNYTEEDESRDRFLESWRDFDNPDPAMRPVIVRTIWIRHDYDEDGIAELQQVVKVGSEILDRIECSRIPVACIVPFINTHRHEGNSVMDLVYDVQRIKTKLLRAGLDSLELSTNPRHAVSDKVKLDDMLVSRPGGIVRLRNGAIPGEGHIMPLPTEFVFPQAQAGLVHMDTVVEARVGVNRMFQGIDSSANNDFNRVGQLSTMAAQRVEDIARIFGSGFKRLFSIAHELIIKSGHADEAIKLRGQWVEINPSQWKTGRDMRVVAPFAAGNKDALMQRLMIIAQFQEKALAAGLPIVDAQDAYELALEISKAADLNGTKFWTDPSQIEPQPEPPDHTMIALEIENKKADNQAADSELDAEVEKYKADLDAQVKQYQVQANQELQLALAQIKAGQQVDLEKVKSELKIDPIKQSIERETAGEALAATQEANQRMAATLQGVVSQMTEALNQANGSKRVVRDQQGKIVGVEPA